MSLARCRQCVGRRFAGPKQSLAPRRPTRGRCPEIRRQPPAHATVSGYQPALTGLEDPQWALGQRLTGAFVSETDLDPNFGVASVSQCEETCRWYGGLGHLVARAHTNWWLKRGSATRDRRGTDRSEREKLEDVANVAAPRAGHFTGSGHGYELLKHARCLGRRHGKALSSTILVASLILLLAPLLSHRRDYVRIRATKGSGDHPSHGSGAIAIQVAPAPTLAGAAQDRGNP